MWYEDQEVDSMSLRCDEAKDMEDSEVLLRLSEECRSLSEDSSKLLMVRARYYYNSFTSLSNYLSIESESLESLEVEKLIEKSLLLCRSSLNLMNQYSLEHTLSAKETSYFQGLYYPTKVNYCNLSVNTGRYPTAIYNMKAIAKRNFGMAIGNLGLEIFDYARLDYDDAHQQILFEKACSLFKKALSYPDSCVHPSAKDIYSRIIVTLTGQDEFEKILSSIPAIDFLEKSDSKLEFNDDEVTKEEFEYRDWATDNALMLNTVNDIVYDYEFSHEDRKSVV